MNCYINQLVKAKLGLRSKSRSSQWSHAGNRSITGTC